MKIIAEITAPVQSASRSALPPALPQPRPVLRLLRTGMLLAVAGVLAACVYQMPIRQGNYLDPAAVAQVKPGMTHSQVRYLLGTPMVPGAFDDARWDYDYYLNLHRLEGPQRAHVTVYFTNNVVARVDSDVKSAPITTVTRGGVKYATPY